MATLPPDPTPEQIEDEILFIGVQIESLDPEANDYEEHKTQLLSQQQHWQTLLERSQRQIQPVIADTGVGGTNQSQRDAWWQATVGNDSDPFKLSSDNESSETLSSQDFPQPGSKRPRTSSHFNIDAPLLKRPAPNALQGDPSFSANHVIADRARRRHEAMELELRKQRELQVSDAAIARQMSQTPGSYPTFGQPSSSQPRTQTTLNSAGGFRRAPLVKSEPDLLRTSLDQQQRSGLDQLGSGTHRLLPHNRYHDLGTASQFGEGERIRPWALPQLHMDSKPYMPFQTPTGGHLTTSQTLQKPVNANNIKSEPTFSRQQLFNTPRQSNSVVDLTGSDSDDEELKEVGSRNIVTGQITPGPSRSAAHQVYPDFKAGLSSIPGVYSGSSKPYGSQPNLSSSYQRSLGNPSNLGNGSRSLQTGHRMSTKELGYMVGATGNYGSLFDDDDDDDPDDDEYGYPGNSGYPDYYDRMGYAGHSSTYHDRYNAMAAYDATKSKEEIEALLKNIRPDEDMPAHLRVKTPESMTISLHKYQELGLTWLQQCEDGSNKGGILADDMGLGKTIQMLSLMVTHKSQDPRCKTTLIVAPVALMRQWKQEIQSKIKPGINHKLTVFVHHGTSKKKDFRDLASFDVILTTYGSLAVEVKKMETFRKRQAIDPMAQPHPKEKCILIGDDARWYRVILDEAQCIKNKSTQTAKGACMVNAKFRWCMTGTPMMNNVEELYSLVHFLRIKPYSQWEKFRMDFKTPLQNSRNDSARATAMRRLQTLCKAIMLRRTKKSTFEGLPILVLPERTTEVDNPEFSTDEKSFYQAIETQSKLQFNKYLRNGQVGSSYTAILVLLLRLRQACCHPHLLKDFGVSAAADLTEDQMLDMAKELTEAVVARIKSTNGTFECPVCYDATSNPAIFIPCGHDTCSECLAKLTDPSEALQQGEEGSTRFRCPNCRGSIDPKRVTDFASFKKIHAPELLTEQEMQALNADDGDLSDSDSDDSDEAEDSDGEDSAGSLKDFIVGDDDEEEESKKNVVKDESEETDDLDAHVSTSAGHPLVIKKEEAGLDVVNGSTDSSKGKQKAKVKSEKKSKSKKGKGKGKEKKKKVKAMMTLAELKKRANRNIASRKKYLKRIRKDWISSAKIDKTMNILNAVMGGEEGEKVLIFSQWTSLLDLLEVPIDDAGYGYRRYDGSMNARMRGDAVDDFSDPNKDVRIMLVSLKAGNAGLNLNMASQVIILDPFWNPYIEEQAIDRAHRIGQRRPVKVHRVLIESTVEDRIIELQEKKRALISEALDEKASQSLSRLGVQELAYLFGVTANPTQQVDYVPRERRR